MGQPEDIDGLLSVDLSDFVAERKALARRLKEAGRTDDAKEVAALRKPPRTAWALNVWAMSDPEAVAELLDSATAVGAAMGVGGAELRAAQSEYGSLVAAALDEAAESSGVSGEPMRDRMRSTLLAAGADPDGPVGQALRNGALRADADAPGFAFAGTAETADSSSETDDEDAAAPEPRRRTPRRRLPRTGKSVRSAPADADEQSTDDEEPATPTRSRSAATPKPTAPAEPTAAELERERKRDEERELERARTRERRALQRDVDRLVARSERLERQAVEAEQRAADARTEADDAADELRAAQVQLDRLGG